MASQSNRSASKRKVGTPALPIQRQLPLAQEGRHHDLRELFDDLNVRYFDGKLRRYRVIWGRRRRLRPKRYLVFGSIQEEDRLIRIHPLLDAPFVPRWFLEYVLYHEMLHAMVPDEPLPGGRRRVHTVEFQRRERHFPHYRKARQWEAANLSRFLR